MYPLHKKQVCLHLKKVFLVKIVQKSAEKIGIMPKWLEENGKKRSFKLG